jgi:hypothetical protein
MLLKNYNYNLYLCGSVPYIDEAGGQVDETRHHCPRGVYSETIHDNPGGTKIKTVHKTVK